MVEWQISEKKRYKCFTCLKVVDETPCPSCGEEITIQPMCHRDHCHCSHDMVFKLEYCPDCGSAVCPECGSHDVAQISRVTGYLSDVAGWNAAKRQEILDRTRYEVKRS